MVKKLDDRKEELLENWAGKEPGKYYVFKTIQSAFPAAKRSSAGVATCATGSIVGSKHFMH